jgi:hypothetical protein
MSTTSISVNDLEVGARIVRKLVEAGYTEVSQLTTDASNFWSTVLSAKEVSQVLFALYDLNPVGDDSPSSTLQPEHAETSSEGTLDDIDFLPVSRRLATRLRALGYHRISDVAKDMHKLPKHGVAYTTVRKIEAAIWEWHSSGRQGSVIKWLPSRNVDEYTDAADLIEALITETLNLFDDRQRSVLAERAFCLDQGGFQTLQELADRFEVTRERIRQIEKKGIAKVRDLVLDCKPVKLLAPRPELKAFWQPLLSELHNLEEISIGELSKLMSATLKIPDAHQNRILALLTPLLTLSVSDDLSARAREGAQYSPVSDLPDGVLDLPITHLRLGNSTAALIDKNIHTLEDFYLFCQVRRSQLGKKQKVAFDALTSLTRDGSNRSADPELQLSYALNVHIHPFAWQGGVADAYTSFIPWFTQVIGIVFTWSKVEDVFRLRTALPAGERMSLAKLSLEISGNSNGGISGRVERYILDGMTAIFVQRDLSKCPIHIPSEVNDLIDSLSAFYSEAAGSFELFSTIISHRFDIPEAKVRKSSHLFWALLSGNLPNRYWHLKEMARGGPAAQKEEVVDGVRTIKLKGFRKRF